MYKSFNQVITDFMGSSVFGQMIKEFENEEFEEAQGEFFCTLEKITSVATNDNESETEKIETVVMAYLGNLEKLGVMVGFKFAFDLLRDLNRFGGDYDV